MRKRYLLSIFLIFTFLTSSGQTITELNRINEHVWLKYYRAFEQLDYNLLAQIHASDLRRIQSERKLILNYKDYIDNFKKTFQQDKKDKTTRKMALRFTERIVGVETASERGIYQLTVNIGKPEERMFYGEFYVLHRKDDGIWKIFIGYDTTKKNSITSEDYDAAFPIYDFRPFVK